MGRFARVLITLVLTSAWTLGTTGSVLAVDPERLQEEIRFRLDFGLRADEAYVSQLISKQNAHGRWPVALSDLEAADLDRRAAMQDELGPLESAAEQLPRFAGHWIDQKAGGVVTVAFSGGDPSEWRQVLEPHLPVGAELRLIAVQYSLADLQRTNDRLENDLSALRTSGIVLGHSGVDLSENRVRVGVVDLTAHQTLALRAEYGELLLIEPAQPTPTACTGRESCFGPPLRAGISVSPRGVTLVNRCSMAFLVHQSTNVQWLTAGHCAPTTAPAGATCPSGNNHAYCWYHAGNGSWHIGQIKATCWPYCSFSDAARGGNINSTFASHKIWLSSSGAMRDVSGSQAFNADNEGNMTCLNARSISGAYTCGYIEFMGRMSYYGGTVWFDEQRFATYNSKYGDSGGAVHSWATPSFTVIAYGVHSGCTDEGPNGVCEGLGVYSHIFRVGQELGVSVCTTANPCP